MGEDPWVKLRAVSRAAADLKLPPSDAKPPTDADAALLQAMRHLQPKLKPVVDEGYHFTLTPLPDDDDEPPPTASSKPNTAASKAKAAATKAKAGAGRALISTRIRAWEALLLHPFLGLFLFLNMWLFAGAAIFYHTLSPFCNAAGLCTPITYPMAMYYSVQCGLSVGFGLLIERNGGPRWYTIFHGFVGVTVMAAALTLFLLRPGGRLVKQISGEEGEGASKPTSTFQRVVRLVPWPIVSLVLLFSTIVIFMCLYNHWSFTDGVYFTFFALSTGGLLSPGSVSDVQMLFCTFALVVGIPLFGSVMARAVDLILDKYVQAVRSSERLQKKFHYLERKGWQSQAATVAEAYEKAAAAAALADEEVAEAIQAERAAAEALEHAAEEADEADEACRAAQEALEHAERLERKSKSRFGRNWV